MLEVERTGQRGPMATRSGQCPRGRNKITTSISRKPSETEPCLL